jgi:hypothetical protein
MTHNRFAISADELEGSARVPISEQMAEQARPCPVVVDPPGGLYPVGDGGSLDADGD